MSGGTPKVGGKYNALRGKGESMNTYEVWTIDAVGKGLAGEFEASTPRGAIAMYLKKLGRPCRPGDVNAAIRRGVSAELQFDTGVVRRWGPLSPLTGLMAWSAGAHSTGGAYLPLAMEEVAIADFQGGVLTAPLNLKDLNARAYRRACTYPGWYAPRTVDEAAPNRLVWTTAHACLTLTVRQDGQMELEMVGRQESRLAAIEAAIQTWDGHETDALDLPSDPPFEEVAPMNPTVPGVAPGWELRKLPWRLRRELGAASGQDPDALQDIVLEEVESRMDPADVAVIRQQIA